MKVRISTSVTAIIAIAIAASTIIRTESLTIRIGTRSSKLAIIQAHQFQNALIKISAPDSPIDTEIVHIDASGDKKDQVGKTPTQNLPLALTGADFTGALDDAVLSGTLDVAVHSMKDIPPGGRWDNSLTIGACLGPRAIPLDVLVTKDPSIKSIQSLPPGSRVGSASIRRQAQLMAINSSLQVINIRGNVDARLKALDNDEVDALVLAMAGLNRLGVLDETTKTIHHPENRGTKYHFTPISMEEMLPGLCQGIIGITCRSDNSEILSLLKDIDNYDSRIAATTERAYLDVVQRVSPWEGRPPLAGYMRRGNSDWMFNGLLATPDGSKVLRLEEFIKDSDCNVERAHRLGAEAGEKVLKLAGVSFLNGFYSKS